ncbi:uncharacterized protein BO80DRAFT_208071 [Aspergillus ibericus CBS 121593]|uniref:Uncharacterized protein n=1 Tax=Aspergillus ibericus CBS 121593 TaxID=1448316 RepID=A0A395HCT3_9EURO|nr:hypothetical protein BO80DRAFT_208071 [Aspergillus ibericus CBS 121593]RAL04768.1 hypothetical protein BO80DRAFT_208071 [Aspergillus ibericus CBS 121593]
MESIKDAPMIIQTNVSRVAPVYLIRPGEKGRWAMVVEGVGRGGPWEVSRSTKALGYVSGGITQSRSESGEQEARKGESRCQIESRRCRAIEGSLPDRDTPKIEGGWGG